MENISQYFNTTTIIFLVVGAILGYLFGLIDSWVTKGIQKKNEEKPEPEVIIKDIPGVLRVKVEEGHTKVEVDGITLSPATMTPDQRARLVNIIVQIRPWIDGKTASAQPAAPAPKAAAPAAAPAPVSLTPSPSTSAVEPPKMNLAKSAAALIKPLPTAAEPPKPTTIIGMIDEVLQEKLLTSPLKDSLIKLEEGRLGEVIVVVGDKKFDGVDAVPDEAVQKIIREAIAEWNASQ